MTNPLTAPTSRLELEALYRSFNKEEWKPLDPIGRVDPLLAAPDFELVAFIVAGLSYGRVLQIQSACDVFFRCLRKLGVGPAGEGLAIRLKKLSPDEASVLREAFAPWKHRMNTAEDMTQLMLRLAAVLKEHGSLCRAFQKSHAEDPAEHITRFCEALVGPRLERTSGPWTGTGVGWFASSPAGGGTCKRLMMWLRWMIRQDNIDPGTWRQLLDPALPRPSAERLFWPVDTHVFRWAQAAGATRYASPSWKSVLEITQFFRRIAPEDPVKYDFAVCHTGMERSKAAARGGPRSKVTGKVQQVRRSASARHRGLKTVIDAE